MNFIRRTMFTAAVTLAASAAAVAADYPGKALDYIIPFGPGGESDITARLQQPFFKEKFGQDLVVSYKPGGGGAVGWAELNRLTGDGYTIMGVNLPHIVLQPAQKDVGYKTDELAVAYWFHYTPDAIVVSADSPFKTLADLTKFAKDNPGKLVFSGSGKGSANHLAQVRFDKLAGIKSTYVAFKGTGASNTALLGGQVNAAWGYTTSGTALGDKARVLAVAMEKRHPKFPDVPTFKELGIDLVSGAYRGIAVPKSTPDEIRNKLSEMIGKINADAEFQKKMIDGGFAMVDVPADKNADFLKAKSQEFIEAAKEGGILK
ncbi:MAG: tripartite tricarboxylate transporter substrate binding protein [Hyphomicrobiaceae bacterium]|nr:tripartite tricarboxylate transporter substrate binding protein [Hyphomicrobiaceae bacterium]